MHIICNLTYSDSAQLDFMFNTLFVKSKLNEHYISSNYLFYKKTRLYLVYLSLSNDFNKKLIQCFIWVAFIISTFSWADKVSSVKCLLGRVICLHPLQARQRVKGVIMNITLTKWLMWLVLMMNTNRVNGFSVFIREFISAFPLN